MIEYIYRGFKVSYEVGESTDAYHAKGYMMQLLKEPRVYHTNPIELTEKTHDLAEVAIKSRLERLIDEVLANFFQDKPLEAY